MSFFIAALTLARQIRQLRLRLPMANLIWLR